VTPHPPTNGAALRREHLPIPLSAPHGPLPDAFGGPREESLDWRRYASAVLRYRWWILGLVAVGALVGTAGARLFPPRYQVQATIWIQASETRSGTSRGRSVPINCSSHTPGRICSSPTWCWTKSRATCACISHRIVAGRARSPGSQWLTPIVPVGTGSWWTTLAARSASLGRAVENCRAVTSATPLARTGHAVGA